MLDMFKRPTDPPEYLHLYAVPATALLATYAAGHVAGEGCGGRQLRLLVQCAVQAARGCPLPTPPVTHPPRTLAPHAGYSEMEALTYLAASGLCIGAIACLAGQKTARLGAWQPRGGRAGCRFGPAPPPSTAHCTPPTAHTRPTGNTLGLIGVGTGLVATLGALSVVPETYAQILGGLGLREAARDPRWPAAVRCGCHS